MTAAEVTLAIARTKDKSPVREEGGESMLLTL